MKNLTKILALLISLVMLCSALAGCDLLEYFMSSYDVQATSNMLDAPGDLSNDPAYDYASIPDIPDYSGKAYVELNKNIPEFTDAEKVTKSYEFYSELDSLGRCGYTMACVGKDIMPTEERESISSVKPTGWVNNKYDTDLVDGGYIYNRCHLIGFQLTGENANKNNLITGTRYLNIEGMLPFENMVADYVKETGNHVMYRVTPMFAKNNLLASGVKIEGWSVEDNGEGICFNVFAYNVQPGIYINYATGDNALAKENFPGGDLSDETQKKEYNYDYVINLGTKKIHTPDCTYAKDMSGDNRREWEGSIEELLDQGYTKCGSCKPE